MITQLQETFSKLWQDRKLDLILLGIALIIPVFSAGIYLTSFPSEASSNEIEFESTETKTQTPVQPDKIHVDISGAVIEPDLYEFPTGARLKDVVKKAGGLSLNADLSFFQRNYNLARVVNDQDKIYIPTVDEVQKGMFTDLNPSADSTSQNKPKSEGDDSNELKININEATVEELDTLPGVGKVTAEKIIDNRPYSALEDLVTKKSLGAAAFEKVKELLTL